MTVPQSPRQRFGELFEAVQRGPLFPDSKTFVDATPLAAPDTIMADYRRLCDEPGFSLEAFVGERFRLPESPAEDSVADGARPVREHIELLWDLLTRSADSGDDPGSLLPLPRPYIVPGGRFREIYYWDSYFTMLGLAVSGRHRLVADMVANFAHLIDRVGFVPNGNRSYFCTRSQPPVFALMVELLAEVTGDPSALAQYRPQLEREYRFWMDGESELTAAGDAHRRVVRVGQGVLNRYWDDADTPREESYLEDLTLAEHSARSPAQLFRDLRAACESGWDFSARWLEDPGALDSIRTTRVLPVDLNALLYHSERVLEAAGAEGFGERAEARRGLLQTLFFDEAEGFFVDLLLPDLGPGPVPSLAACFPLFLGIARQDQAEAVAARLETGFLRPGGWVTTPLHSGQQWDAPNGWAPLQWAAYAGLRRYGLEEAARKGATRWVETNIAAYRADGQLAEKYNVEQPTLPAGGGEYRLQTGFGWTNGVLLRLLEELGRESAAL